MEYDDIPVNQTSIEQIHGLIEQYIPLEMCRCYSLLPLAVIEENPPSLLVGMVNPDDLEALDRLNSIAQRYNRTLRRVLLSPDNCQQLIQRLLAQNVAQHPMRQELNLDTSNNLDSFKDSLDEDIGTNLDTALQDSETPLIIAWVNMIIAKAIAEKASYIHIEPQTDRLRIRFRKDGVLRDAIDSLPRKQISAIVSRFKIIANLDISERRIPQFGKIRRLFEGRKIELFISTLPSQFGERIVVKIKDTNLASVKLEHLIQDSKACTLLKELLKQPRGLILVTSPPNAGKTTTLYALLNQYNRAGASVCTLEDPIELEFPGMTQVQVLREKGMDYASCLNALLHQDIDAIMVGDIPDRGSAIAMLAAARKSLVLVGLSASSNESAIRDLQLAGIENWKIARPLLGAVNQRLLRRVCQDCRLVHRPTREELAQFGELASSISDVVFYKAKELAPAERTMESNSPSILDHICPKCRGSGYEGVVAVCEVMRITEEIQNLIIQERSTNEIRNAAIAAGMRTILDSALDLLANGETTLEELEHLPYGGQK
jgi:type IV pilus assembly protein PilB